MPSKRKIVLAMSDFHAGHKLSICNPEATTIETHEQLTPQGITIDEYEQPVKLEPNQKYLWALHETNLKKVSDLAGKDPIIAIHAGDLTQGNWSRFTKLMTSSMSNQYRLAAFNFLPVMQLNNIKHMLFVTGTEVHIGYEGEAPHQVKRNLEHPEFYEKYNKKIPIKVANHALVNIDGLVFDIAHHGSYPGSRAWLTGNNARYEMKSNFIAEKLAGNIPPDLYIRGHFHKQIWEPHITFINDVPIKTEYIIIPSMTGMNMHAKKQSKSAHSVTNGYCAIEIIDGKVRDIHWFIKTVDLRVKEVIEL